MAHKTSSVRHENKISTGDLVNYAYKVDSRRCCGWGRVVGRGRFHGMGKVIHVLPYEEREAIAICLRPKEIIGVKVRT